MAAPWPRLNAAQHPRASRAIRASRCRVCAQVRREVDFRQVRMLLHFVGEQGMLLGRRKGAVAPVTQRKIARAVKNARQMALLPFVGVHPGVAPEEALDMQDMLDTLDARAKERGL